MAIQLETELTKRLCNVAVILQIVCALYVNFSAFGVLCSLFLHFHSAPQNASLMSCILSQETWVPILPSKLWEIQFSPLSSCLLSVIHPG